MLNSELRKLYLWESEKGKGLILPWERESEEVEWVLREGEVGDKGGW